jgi:hypothetical protein
MKAPRSSQLRSSGRLTRTLLFLILLSLAACTPQATPTLFIPPTDAAPPPATTVAVSASTAMPTPTTPPTATALTPTSAPCNNDLSFVQDLTVPDGTSVTPSESVDKQWLVTNTGTCNWDSAYRLKLITGDAMGVPTQQALYPARAGTQATLRIVFTAPQTAGNYSSAWQAVAPDGTSFGQAVYVQINVAP